jgi:hypothetical protein
LSLPRFLPPGDLDGVRDQSDHALIRHFELHFAQRPAFVIGDRFVVIPKAQCIGEGCLDKFLGGLPRRPFVRVQTVSSIVRGNVIVILKKVIAVSPLGVSGSCLRASAVH